MAGTMFGGAEGSAASVPSPKSGDYLGAQSTFLARCADAGISGIFRGGATLPGTSRAGEIVTGLRGRDTRSRQSKRAQLPAHARQAQRAC